MSGATFGWLAAQLARPWLWAALVAAFVLAAALLAEPGGPEQITRLFVRHDGTWAAMQARRTWRVGLDPSFPPFEMLDEAGNPWVMTWTWRGASRRRGGWRSKSWRWASTACSAQCRRGRSTALFGPAL